MSWCERADFCRKCFPSFISLRHFSFNKLFQLIDWRSHFYRICRKQMSWCLCSLLTERWLNLRTVRIFFKKGGNLHKRKQERIVHSKDVLLEYWQIIKGFQDSSRGGWKKVEIWFSADCRWNLFQRKVFKIFERMQFSYQI